MRPPVIVSTVFAALAIAGVAQADDAPIVIDGFQEFSAGDECVNQRIDQWANEGNAFPLKGEPWEAIKADCAATAGPLNAYENQTGILTSLTLSVPVRNEADQCVFSLINAFFNEVAPINEELNEEPGIRFQATADNFGDLITECEALTGTDVDYFHGMQEYTETRGAVSLTLTR